MLLPEHFEERLGVEVKNARERIDEARELGERLLASGIALERNPDHFAMFTEPPQLLAGPLKRIGYVIGADNRCYPSPVDGCDYINVAASLPAGSALRAEGWPDHIAVVWPLDQPAGARMSEQGYGNPFVHHITFGIARPEQTTAEAMVRRMVQIRRQIAGILQQEPGTLIMALPAEVIRAEGFAHRLTEWTSGLAADQYQLEEMEGGGYLLQFFILRGGRIEVALRSNTRQTFNPKSVHKISEDELSVDQGPVAMAGSM